MWLIDFSIFVIIRYTDKLANVGCIFNFTKLYCISCVGFSFPGDRRPIFEGEIAETYWQKPCDQVIGLRASEKVLISFSCEAVFKVFLVIHRFTDKKNSYIAIRALDIRRHIGYQHFSMDSIFPHNSSLIASSWLNPWVRNLIHVALLKK